MNPSSPAASPSVYEHGACSIVQEDPERIDSERRSKRQDEQIKRAQPQDGKSTTGMIAAKFAAGPGVGATANKQRDREYAKCDRGNARSHAVATRPDANGDGAHGKEKHRDAKEEADAAPHELQDPKQVKMCTQGLPSEAREENRASEGRTTGL
jgi:hypothetical protein